jgi:hypothetical protein
MNGIDQDRGNMSPSVGAYLKPKLTGASPLADHRASAENASNFLWAAALNAVLAALTLRGEPRFDHLDGEALVQIKAWLDKDYER